MAVPLCVSFSSAVPGQGTCSDAMLPAGGGGKNIFAAPLSARLYYTEVFGGGESMACRYGFGAAYVWRGVASVRSGENRERERWDLGWGPAGGAVVPVSGCARGERQTGRQVPST